MHRFNIFDKGVNIVSIAYTYDLLTTFESGRSTTLNIYDDMSSDKEQKWMENFNLGNPNEVWQCSKPSKKTKGEKRCLAGLDKG